MKSILLIIILLTLIFVFAGNIYINFNPFKIGLSKPYMAFGWIFIVLAISCFTIQGEKTGYKKGRSETIEIVNGALKQLKNTP